MIEMLYGMEFDADKETSGCVRVESGQKPCMVRAFASLLADVTARFPSIVKQKRVSIASPIRDAVM